MSDLWDRDMLDEYEASMKGTPTATETSRHLRREIRNLHALLSDCARLAIRQIEALEKAGVKVRENEQP